MSPIPEHGSTGSRHLRYNTSVRDMENDTEYLLSIKGGSSAGRHGQQQQQHRYA